MNKKPWKRLDEGTSVVVSFGTEPLAKAVIEKNYLMMARVRITEDYCKKPAGTLLLVHKDCIFENL